VPVDVAPEHSRMAGSGGLRAPEHISGLLCSIASDAQDSAHSVGVGLASRFSLLDFASR